MRRTSSRVHCKVFLRGSRCRGLSLGCMHSVYRLDNTQSLKGTAPDRVDIRSYWIGHCRNSSRLQVNNCLHIGVWRDNTQCRLCSVHRNSPLNDSTIAKSAKPSSSAYAHPATTSPMSWRNSASTRERLPPRLRSGTDLCPDHQNHISDCHLVTHR